MNGTEREVTQLQHFQSVRVSIVLLLNVGVVLTTCATPMYRHVDEDGHITYADHPISASDEKISVQTPPANLNEAARLGRERTKWLHEEAVEQNRDQAKREQRETLEKKREQFCKLAKDHYLEVTEHDHLYRRDEKGERVYYSAEEIDKMRATAKKAMDAVCSSK